MCEGCVRRDEGGAAELPAGAGRHLVPLQQRAGGGLHRHAGGQPGRRGQDQIHEQVRRLSRNI